MMTQTYGELSKGMKPAPLVMQAAKILPDGGVALDIGAGSLRNTQFLLQNNFTVTAVDTDPVMVERAAEVRDSNLITHAGDFVDFEYENGTYNLIIAINSLPFVSKDVLLEILPNIKESLMLGGVLCLTLFGERDGWSDREEMAFFSRSEVEELFEDMETRVFIEEDSHGKTIKGEPKYWHMFKVITKRAV